MASEDVIELGSSDEETPPAQEKKMPLTNTMVQIPDTLPELTIKSTKLPLATYNKAINGKSKSLIKVISQDKLGTPCMTIKNAAMTRPILNPANLVKNLNINAHLKINKLPSIKSPFKNTNSKKIILPPCITITKTKNPSQILKRKHIANIPMAPIKRQKILKPKSVIGEVLTVELDDDDTPTTSAGPQWYLRPEEQKEEQPALSKEDENNKEPNSKNIIEITIDDSPVKPICKKNTHEIGAELSITVDDSPIKNLKSNAVIATTEHKRESKKKDSQSKKKLEYPEIKNTEIDHIQDAVEVEANMTGSNSNEINNENIIDIEESPIKEVQIEQIATPKKNESVKQQFQSEKIRTNLQLDTGSNDFNPIYQQFIDLCFKLENSDDMSKIVEKKIKTYYWQVSREYTDSEEFIDMVTSKILAMKANPEKMYLYIKDIVDELNLQRKMNKTQPENKEITNTDVAKSSGNTESHCSNKRERQIRKLEKTIRKLHRAIQRLEEQDVDFDDEEDSVYLLTDRYKERMVRVHAKLCQLTNTKMPSEPRVQIDARPGRPQGPAKRLERLINKKVPIGSPLPFPDFHDVLRCVREANKEDNLMWNEAELMEEARDLFTRCGKKLQRRRQENEWRLAASRLTTDVDPADQSEQLRQKLELTKKQAIAKENEVFNKYAERQNQLKLEGEEIEDKEAEESPIESDDNDQIDESALVCKDNRKQRLRRLLHEKTKKSIAEKENLSNDENTLQIEKTETNNMEVSGDVNSILKETNNLESKNNEEMEVDALELNQHNELDKNNSSEESDNSNKIESDIDELHLLQKICAKNSNDEINSSSSDSECSIAISDTLESNSDDENKAERECDVISIEDSSYSESEANIKEIPVNEDDFIPGKINTKDLVEGNIETGTITEVGDNNFEYDAEDLLLATSDDDVERDADREIDHNGSKKSPSGDKTCINLNDDSISIGETMIDGVMRRHEGDDIKKNDGETQNHANICENDGCTKDKNDIEDDVNLNMSIDLYKTEEFNNAQTISSVESVISVKCDEHDSGNRVGSVESIEAREKLEDINSIEFVKTVNAEERSEHKVENNEIKSKQGSEKLNSGNTSSDIDGDKEEIVESEEQTTVQDKIVSKNLLCSKTDICDNVQVMENNNDSIERVNTITGDPN